MILVDPRVGTSRSQSRQERLDKLLALLRSRVQCKVMGRRLAGGDFAFGGDGPDGPVTIGIELKEIRDFLGSMRSERLAGDQVVKMADDYDVVFIIVQGLWRPGKTGMLEMYSGGKEKWKTLDLAANHPRVQKCFYYAEPFKHIVSLSIIKNVVVLRSMSEDETAWMIAHLYAWWQKPWAEHRSTDPIKLQTEVVFHRVSTLRKWAAELPGIGWTRSLAVEKAFRSAFAMANAPVEAWEAIEGIGPKTALSVWRAIRAQAEK